jgi:hypothetical protein
MKRVLAIDPITRGFGYAVLDGPDFLIDWGTKGTSRWPESRERWCLREIGELIEAYGPDRVVVEDCLNGRSRRGGRNRRLIDRIVQLAEARGISCQRVSQTARRRAVLPIGSGTKYKTALAIAERFPELHWRLPPKRKPWMSEDARMGLFDAVALALSSYARSHMKGTSEAVTVSALKGGETAPSIMRRT